MFQYKKYLIKEINILFLSRLTYYKISWAELGS